MGAKKKPGARVKVQSSLTVFLALLSLRSPKEQAAALKDPSLVGVKLPEAKLKLLYNALEHNDARKIIEACLAEQKKQEKFILVSIIHKTNIMFPPMLVSYAK